MSMTRSEFNMAFSTVIAEEFADVPDESEIEVEFSDEFNRKMQELIEQRSEQRSEAEELP